MWIKSWGTRGSIPTSGLSTVRYGGNTSCVELRFGQQILMFDCGTGAREMGLALAKEFKGRSLEVSIFVGHTHWDHIQGFPFFAPAYGPGNRVNIYSLRGSDKSLEKVFTGQMDLSYFPVTLQDLRAQLHFVELQGPVRIGEATISHIYLNHPGLAIGFRVDLAQQSLVYLTDHESYCRLLGDNEHNRKLDAQVVEFAQGADLYIREGPYTEEEYPSRQGWGHSTWTEALEAAHQAQARRLALYHHDPLRDDATLDSLVEACHAYMRARGLTFECFAASDNLELTF